MTSNSLFVYGTLMSPEVVAKVLRSSTNSHTETQNAQLPNFQRHKVHGEYYPAAVPRQGSSITGALIEGISDSEMAFMDEYEGEEYTRVPVRVIVDGQEKDCDVYVWCAGTDRLLDEDWVLDDDQIRQFLATF